MKQPEFKDLLQELIDKEISLDQSAKILWQLRMYTEAQQNERYAEVRNADVDTRGNLGHTTELHRLQLEHYLVINGISRQIIDRLVKKRNDKMQTQ